jgi:hypothetical protein
MSRFPELFEEAIEAVVGTRGAARRGARRDIARHIVGRQSALRAEARITRSGPCGGRRP